MSPKCSDSSLVARTEQRPEKGYRQMQSEHRPSQRTEPLRTTLLPECPWQHLGADLCTYQGNDYLIMVDYYSRWLEIQPLHSTTAAVVIKKFTQIFSVHGITSDNGPQFQCAEFRDFALEFDFRHKTSSPFFPQTNGEAESAVKVVKKLLSQQSLEIALLNYRTTPHSSTGTSPASALMGRQLKTKIPRLPENLTPQPASDIDIRKADHHAKARYKFSYDRRHGATPLSQLEPENQVLIKTDGDKTWDKPGTIVAADPENRSYLVNSPTGVLRRNRKHLQQVPSPLQTGTFDHSSQQSSSTFNSKENNTENINSKDIVPVNPTHVTRTSSGYKTPQTLRFREEDEC